MTKQVHIGDGDVVQIEDLQEMETDELVEIRDQCIDRVNGGMHNTNVMVLAGYLQAVLASRES